VMRNVRHPSLHMISLIHIADKNDEASTIKNGLRSVKRKTGPRGVYAVPVVPNYATTYKVLYVVVVAELNAATRSVLCGAETT
jgi:hypothetical protein